MFLALVVESFKSGLARENYSQSCRYKNGDNCTIFAMLQLFDIELKSLPEAVSIKSNFSTGMKDCFYEEKYLCRNENVLRKAVTAVLSKSTPVKSAKPVSDAATDAPHVDHGEGDLAEDRGEGDKDPKEQPSAQHSIAGARKQDVPRLSHDDPPTAAVPGGRHRIKKTIVVGNISKYIPPDKREGNDKSTHKWMVYVRGGKDEPRIDRFVRKVWFFLHPSYRPHDLVEVAETPFHLTRRGWGEFPIRVQLHFCDPRNRRVDIIHHLKLDRTYTGLQTLGAETVCEVELDRSTLNLTVDSLLQQDPAASDHPLLPDLPDKQQEDDDISADVSMKLGQLPIDASDVAKHRMPERGTPDGDTEAEQAVDAGDAADSSIVTSTTSDVEMETPKPNAQCKDSSTSGTRLLQGMGDEPGSTTSPEKKTRRRRVSSCRGSDESGASAEKKSLALRLLGGNDCIATLENDDARENSSRVDEGMAASSKGPSPILPVGGGPAAAVVKIEESVEKLVSFPSEHSKVVHPFPGKGTVSSPATVGLSAPVPSKAQSVTRLRSASAELAGQSPTGPSTVMLVKKFDADGRPRFAQIAGQRLLVLNRPRSKSATGSAPASPQHSALTPLPALKQLAAPSVEPVQTTVARKRQHEVAGACPPEKQAKVEAAVDRGERKDSQRPQTLSATSSGLTLIIPRHTQQTQDASKAPTPHPPTPAAQPESRGGAVAKPPAKSIVLRGSKDGLVLVSGVLLKETTQNPAEAQISRKSCLTGLSQQQLRSLKALQSALVGAGVNLNRPVKIKVEKAPVSMQAQVSPQFALSTIINEQGKKQISLVNIDQLQTVKTGSTKKGESSKASTYLPRHESAMKSNTDGSLAFHEKVGNKILRAGVSSISRDALPMAADAVPLVKKDGNVVDMRFVAESEAEFLLWNVGKQRAAEWQRAVLIRRILCYVKDKSTSLRDSTVPSKRSIAQWCLTRGYSVFSDEFENSDNVIGGCPAIERLSKFQSTLTSHGDILEHSLTLDGEGGQCRFDEEVDVVSVSAHQNAELTNEGAGPSAPPSGHPKPRLHLQPSGETALVGKVARQVGVNYTSTPVSTDLSAPLCQVVLARALELFCCEVKREALASAIKRRDGGKVQRVLPGVIGVQDVIDGVKGHHHLDIITDHCMGV